MVFRMSPLSFAAFVLLSLCVDAGNTSNGSNATTTTTTTTLPPLKVVVDVQGQSGKFTVFEESKGGSGIQITMDALREVDAQGNAVGTMAAPSTPSTHSRPRALQPPKW
mmetsp:Transcript_15868/g.39888  ORF Transcript_15868/g.39888 Transcript_15868/m.39888 type:complete len:109 (+) Transcript_15868:56-382(+)